MEPERKSPPIVPLLIILGGILVIVSYFPKWGRVTGLTTHHFQDVKGGTPVLIAGIVGVALGVLLWALRSRGARIAISIIAILGGLAAILAGAGASSKSVIRDTVADQIADLQHAPHGTVERQFKQAEASGEIRTTTSSAWYFTLAGGVLVLIGGIGGLVTGRKRAETAVPLPPGETAFAPPPPPSFPGDQATQTMPPASEGPGSQPAPPPPPPAQSEPPASEPPPAGG
jgi:hypothetical protein